MISECKLKSNCYLGLVFARLRRHYYTSIVYQTYDGVNAANEVLTTPVIQGGNDIVEINKRRKETKGRA